MAVVSFQQGSEENPRDSVDGDGKPKANRMSGLCGFSNKGLKGKLCTSSSGVQKQLQAESAVLHFISHLSG